MSKLLMLILSAVATQASQKTADERPWLMNSDTAFAHIMIPGQ